MKKMKFLMPSLYLDKDLKKVKILIQIKFKYFKKKKKILLEEEDL
jgi:hypothetical protein